MNDSLQQAWEHYRETTPSLAWMEPGRENALRAFTAGGFPTTREEDWKYTNLHDFQARAVDYLGLPGEAGQAPAAADKTIDRLLGELPGAAEAETLLVFSHGQFDPSRSRIAATGGQSVSPLTAVPKPEQAVVEKLLGTLASPARYRLAALNAAYVTDGVVIDVAEDARIDTPILVVHVSTGQPRAAQPRLLVRAGAGSRLALTECFTGSGETLTNAVAEIFCADGASVEYVKLQTESRDAQHVANQQVRLGRDSRFVAVHVETGAAMARNDLAVRLEGTGAEAALHGLFVPGRSQHIDQHTSIEHGAGETTSRARYRGIVDAGGRGVFNGRILVEAGADGTDAALNNRNLLLDKGAEIDTKPELEIYADDVKCAHGATTGQLDADAMYYLRSRGIAASDARQMLVAAFAAEIVRELGGESLRKFVDTLISSRLAGEVAS